MLMRKLFCVYCISGILDFKVYPDIQANGLYIKGKVTDKNGYALAGATITIENTFPGYSY